MKTDFIIRAVYIRFFKKLLFILQVKYVVKDEDIGYTTFTVETHPLSYNTLLAIETIAENITIRLHPLIPQDFVNEYVSEYNRGNIITNVLVEYEPYCPSTCNSEGIRNYQLKVDLKDNTITIKGVKDSWTREEVIDLIKAVHRWTDDNRCELDRIAVGLSDGDADSILKEYNVDKWIKANL